ncbi:efflux RND transporter periplasmic adaptor subunit [Pelolinea submarina]|uniref:HlyD family secretion protein n=1 Tax=Pelolinea submarina TaxID=913107 RepID=A0A347ZPQ2_9CHLR|nr:efflux RND transporter periplasmic adaptor subunit [Pelolinea submarina]REG04702.1 HlyD family secretion protein [Pelolinea submarina]BBB47283.1 HlyD family secretion protein [Pelolinea submarina]
MDIEKIKTTLVDFYDSRKKLVWIIGAVLLVAIVALIAFPKGSKASVDTEVSYGQVTRGSLTETIDVVGTLEAIPAATLTWQSGGIVDSFDVKVGDKVSQGDVLMTLTESTLDATILDAQSSLLDAKTTLENLKSANTDLYTAAQTLADAEYELRQYKSDRDYYNTKGASDDTIEAAREAYYAAKQVVWEKQAAYDALSDLEADDPEKMAAYDEQKAAIEAQNKALSNLNYILGISYDYGVETNFIEYDAALAAVEEARVEYNRYLDQSDEIAAAEASVQALENTINTGKIVAPFDGTITQIDAVAGDLITSYSDSDNTTAALTISNLDNLMVEVSISEVDINKVAVGQRAVITFDAISNKKYTGYVSSISSSGEEDENGIVQFSVWVKVDDTDEKVRPGFTSVVSIVTAEVEDALLVPYDAVVSRDGSYMVVLADNSGNTTMVPVEIGATSDLFAEVTGGELKEGDQVVLYTSNNSADFGMVMMSGGGGGQPPSDGGSR